jgi:hypothetical protein
VATEDNDILAEFAEFMKAKKESESQEAASEDHDVEIWDEKGRGARVKRSMAKPFLQSLGIDMDPEPATDDTDEGNSGTKAKPKPGPKGPTNSTARKYFVKTAGK